MSGLVTCAINPHKHRDPEIAGADFFVMERKRGEVIRGVIPETMRDHEDVGRRIGFALVDAMADFHRVDPEFNSRIKTPKSI